MANKYANPTNQMIHAGLEKGYPIQDMMLWNTTTDQGSRIAWWFANLYLLYHDVNPKLETIKLKVNAQSIEELKRNGLWKVLGKWKLFRYDDKEHRYHPNLLPKETDKQFKLRVQRTISKQVALWWVVRDLVEVIGKDGKGHPRPVPSPHTNIEFMQQVLCTEQTVTRYVNQVTSETEWEYCLRLRGNGKGKASYFVRHDAEELLPGIDRYPFHKTTHRTPRRYNIVDNIGIGRLPKLTQPKLTQPKLKEDQSQ
jgi:hypothetical protein